MKSSIPLLATTLPGLEPLLQGELEQLGAQALEPGRRHVRFVGDRELLYRANLWLRTAIRVLCPIHTFKAEREQEFYEQIQAVDWRRYLEANGSLWVDPVVFSSFCTHSQYVAQLTKDAIVDQLRLTDGTRPRVERHRPDVRVHVHLDHDRGTISLDASGESLHRRGYRREATVAPLNEALAAGLVLLTNGLQAPCLLDPMCGSGTLVIEAALIALDQAPGLTRLGFGFQRWPDFDAGLWSRLVEEARSRRRGAPAGWLGGSDRDPAVLEVARRNAARAGVAEHLHLEVADFHDRLPPAESGILLFNPPYDERLKLDDVADEYARIGDTLKRHFPGFRACLLTGNLQAAKQIGLRTSRRHTLFNGALECRLLEYELFAGARVAERRDAGSGLADSPVNPSAEPHGINASGVGAAIDTTRLNAAGMHPEAPPANVATLGATADRPVVPPAAGRSAWFAGLDQFANRLARMARHRGKWARRQGITCYRLYDRDVPGYPLVIDWYDGRVVVSYFEKPASRRPDNHAGWLREIRRTIREGLGIAPEALFFKVRRRQSGKRQYERISERGVGFEVREGPYRFRVNLSDYLDCGLFLDHRITRARVGSEAAGKRFLNLFGYTGTFTVYAAGGGARATTTVDTSKTYLDWAADNLARNGLAGPQHEWVQEDALRFLERYRQRRGEPYDLVVADPPTFSNNRQEQRVWDVQRDYLTLVHLILDVVRPGGVIYFSTNAKGFEFGAPAVAGATVRDITRQTIPHDFEGRTPHQCFTIVKL